MPIDTRLLAGSIDTSSNPVLAQLWIEIGEFNAIPRPIADGVKPRAIKLLDKIMKRAAIYLTSKPPQAGKAKNQQRWNALTDLAIQAVVESKTLGIKLLTSPADFRDIKGDPRLGAQSYWLERVDPSHRAGFQLSAKYEEWIRGGSAAHAKSTFWDFADADAMMKVLFLGESDVDGSGVQIRECYRCNFAANGLVSTNDGSPFATRDLETAHSGAGWAVFVVDPSGKMYARAHEVGYFHHSTFLAGRPVAAAGEVLIDDAGAIRFITAKTGHYRAGPDEMVRMVTLIPEIPGNALILPDFAKMNPVAKGGQNVAHLYKVSDFRSRGVNAPIATKSEVEAAFPGFGKTSASVLHMIGKVPTTRPMNPNAPAFVPSGRP